MKNYINKFNNLRVPLLFQKLKISFICVILISFLFGIYESLVEGSIIWKIARNETGELVWKLLIFTIFISLLSKIFPKTKIWQQCCPLRKYSGLLAFFLTITHAAFHYLRANVFGDLEGMYFQSIERNWVILLGTISFLIMLPLAITSTTFAMKKMGYSSWKNLQRFTHVAFVLAAIHVSFIEYPGHGEITLQPLILLAIYALSYGYLFVRERKK